MKATLISILIVSSFLSCKKGATPTDTLVGTWKYEYELKSDGTRDYGNPYALLQFEYSDGFILYDNGTGNTMWYDKINDPEPFEWSYKSGKIRVEVSNVPKAFEYGVANLKEGAMNFTTGGREYYMTKR